MLDDKYNSEPIQAEGFAARWRNLLKTLQAAFPSPWKEAGEDQTFENTFLAAVGLVDSMKHPRVYGDQNVWKEYLGDPALPDYSTAKEARLGDHVKPLAEVIAETVSLFNGMPNWNHPQSMANVIPPSNAAAIIGATLCQVFNPNLVEGEYSWSVARTELESAAMVAQLIGWDPDTAGGIFTFGGTGCYLYGTKLALTTVLGKETRSTGIREDGQILVSYAGHFAKKNCADWTGLGMDNIRDIQVDDFGRMSIPHLKQVMEACKREGKPVVMIVCTMGTTDAFAVDPIGEVRQVIDQYENAKGYPKPFLYADAVIGWSWLAFDTYDFKQNPLQFSSKALAVLEQNYRQIEPLRHADAIGIDFHKTGWATYNCSLFMVRDYDKFSSLLERPTPAYLQDRTPYNPYQFTLETSRSGAYSTAAWATLRLFGREGFQVMLGRIIEVEMYFRRLLDREPHLVCVNPENYGFVTLFRVYPSHIRADEQYHKELNDPQYREELRAYNLLQQRIANKVFAMLRDPNQKIAGWENPPYISFTSGFRPPAYVPDETDRQYWIYALKAFPMSPNSNELSMQILRNYIVKARDLVIDELVEESRRQQDSQKVRPGPATPRSATRSGVIWLGDNEHIPVSFLTPSEAAYAGVADVAAAGEKASRQSARSTQTLTENAPVESILKNTPLCSHLTATQLSDLVSSGKAESVAANQILFSEGDQADKIYLILSGKVKVYKNDQQGHELELSTLGSGDLFGEMALFERGLRGASVKCLVRSDFFVLQGEKFISLLLG